MATFQVLALLCLLLACQPKASSACQDHEWSCFDDTCILGTSRCDGVADCPGGTDESTLSCEHDPHKFYVSNWDLGAVTVEYKSEFSGIELSLCGPKTCTTIQIYGADKHGALWYHAAHSCVLPGLPDDCVMYTTVAPHGAKNFKNGTLKFRVERRDAMLAVWMSGRSAEAEFPALPENKMFHVVPIYWHKDMKVDYRMSQKEDAVMRDNEDESMIGAEVHCSPLQWQCESGGVCIEANMRCDHIKHCPDGSDEKLSVCTNGTSIQLLDVGDEALVKVPYEHKYYGLDISLCSDIYGYQKCSTIRLYGSNVTGGLWYSARKHCSGWGVSCSHGYTITPPGAQLFQDHDMELKVERRPEELAVWINGKSRFVATVPDTRYGTKLLVKPVFWVTRTQPQFHYEVTHKEEPGKIEATTTTSTPKEFDSLVLGHNPTVWHKQSTGAFLW